MSDLEDDMRGNDAERRIRETVEGKGAMKVMSAEARLLHIANLLGTEYVATEKLPGWEPPVVTDAEVRAIGQRVYGDWQHPQNPKVLNEMQWQAASDAAEAAAAIRQGQQ